MPLFISPRTGNFTARRVSFGALGDSYYEYLLKMWIVKGKSDEMYRSMWEKVREEGLGQGLGVGETGGNAHPEHECSSLFPASTTLPLSAGNARDG